MFSKNLKKHFKKNNYGGRRPFRKEYNKDNKKELIICYECKNSGHMKMNCPKLKNHGKDYKRNKKAMVVAWRESAVANLCLIALEDEDSTQEEVTTLYEELKSSFHELQDEFRKVCAKNNVLKKPVASLTSNVEELKKEKIVLKNDFDTISHEKTALKNNVDDLTKTLENFVKGRNNLNMLLGN